MSVAQPLCASCLRQAGPGSRLVAGSGVHLCADCVALGAGVVADPPSPPAGRTTDDEDTSVRDVLASLPRIAAVAREVEAHLGAQVRRARALGATWAAIGAALSMTRQSAWERFSAERPPTG